MMWLPYAFRSTAVDQPRIIHINTWLSNRGIAYDESVMFFLQQRSELDFDRRFAVRQSPGDSRLPHPAAAQLARGRVRAHARP